MAGRKTKSVTVLGGSGVTGELSVKRLVKGRKFDEIRIADINVDRARMLAKELGGAPTIRAIELDAANKDSLAAAVKDVDVVINDIGPYYKYGRLCLIAALDAGAHYVDVNDEVDVTIALFDDEELKKRVTQQGLTAIVGLGTSPGLTNIFARFGADQLSSVDAIEIRLVSNSRYRSRAVFEHRLHVFGNKALVFRDGRWQHISAFTERETISFPADPGEGACFIVGHPEPATLPRHIPSLKNVDVKLGYIPDEFNVLLKNIVDLGLGSEIRVPVGGDNVSTAEVVAAYLGSPQALHLFERMDAPPTFGRQVRVSGKVGERNVKFTYKFAGTESTRYTGVLPVLAAELLVSGAITERGMLAPEALKPEPFLAEAMSMGLVCKVIREETSDLSVGKGAAGASRSA